MDEPLSNLDAKLRVGMRASLAQLHQQLGVTTVYVTHDQVEAMTLGQRVAVMRDGHILQVDTPQTLYEQPMRPVRRRVHRLAGDEPRRGDASTATRSSSVSSAIPLDRGDGDRCDRAARVILGIRPETFEDAAFASPELPTIDVEVVVLEELGSDAHVFFRVDATRIAAERSMRRRTTATDLVDRSRLASQRAGRSANDGACRGSDSPRGRSRRGSTSSTPRRAHHSCAWPWRSRSSRLPRSRAEPASWSLTSTGGSVTMLRVTKQAATRDLVLDLIEQLAVGDAIPSERQLSADFGVSRLTVRAALDDLVREGYLVRRHGSGTFVSEPKIAQELTMTSFTDDMRQPRAAAGERDARSPGRAGRRASRPAPPRLAFGARARRGPAQARRRREHGDRDRAHPSRRTCPDSPHAISRSVSFYELLRDRYGIVVVGGEQTIEPTVTDEDESTRARRAAPLAGVSLRARDALGGRGDRRVRRVDLPRRPVPPRDVAVDSAGATARRAVDGATSGRVSLG